MYRVSLLTPFVSLIHFISYSNSAFGRTITDKEKYTKISYAHRHNASEISSTISNKLFLHAEHIGEDLLEIERLKASVVIDQPLTVGFFCLENGKLLILDFYYSFLKKFIPDSDFTCLQSDTDSLYLALAQPSIFQCIKPELRDEFILKYEQWFAREFCDEHKDTFFSCMFTQTLWAPCDRCELVKKFEQRSVGKFHIEWKGDGVISLASKSYFCMSDTRSKISSKGISKRLNKLTEQHYLSVLQTKEAIHGINMGFRLKGNDITTYIQSRKGLSYLYCKRPVKDDGISTGPTYV